MSLQVWLPLNGDLTQQGLSKISVTNNGATINDNGKIGKCYSFDGSDDFISLNNQKLYDIFKGGTQQFSIAFWVYHADATRAIIFGDYGLTGSISFNIELTTSHAVRFYWAGAPDKNFNSTSYVTASAWTHICITYDGSKIQIYRNGILSTDVWSGTLATRTKTSGAFYLGRDNRTGATALNGKLNDFRIYDHCLSNKEVKKLAQGLILYYKLDQNIPIKNNLMPNSLNMALGTANVNTGTWRTAGSNNMTRSRVAITDTPDGNGYGFQNTGIQTANDGSCYGIDSFPLVGNTIYTIYMWARITNGTEGYAGFAIYNETDIIGSHNKIDKGYKVTTLPSSGEWTLCWLTFLTSAANTRNIYIGVTTGSTSVTVQMCNVHIYKGSFFNKIIISDNSGYNNNGMIFGTINTIYNAIRYNGAISMNNIGTSNHIESIENISIPSNNITISCWVKATNKATNQVFFTMSNIQFGTLNNLGYVNPTSMAGFTLNNFINNEWNHIVVIKNGTTYQLYINGIAETQNGASNYYLHNSSKLWLLNRSYNNTYAANASISDLRIYSTILSIDDIKELYKTSKAISGTIVTARDLE